MTALPALLSPDALAREIAKAEARVRRAKAPTSLIDFAQTTSPDPMDPDGLRSTYEIAPHHALVAQKLDDLFHGRIQKLAIAIPPRGGKTELGARRLIPWWLGRRPRDHIAFATYNETFAGEIGGEVRNVLHSAECRAVFPNLALDMTSQNTARLALEGGGRAIFVGRGGALTGRGFDLGIVDDLIKDADEAESLTLREQAWRWFTRTFLTRRMRHDSRVLVIGTRWHEDDVQGRLTDPRNPCYNEDEAKTWTILRIPAISEGKEVDPLGRERGEALWATRFPAAFLNSQKNLDPKGFSALYQGKPTPDEGAHFKREMLKTYTRQNAPSRDRLRFYCSSDHAVGTKQRNDLSCLLPVGVDEDDNVFVMPEVVWKRMPADETVAEMIRLMQTFNPLFWWAENGHISKSIGPFLHKRMSEKRVYCAIEEITPTADKQTRSQAIHGRMAMGKVFFPSFAPWWPEAMHEMLTFPGGAHDDFVDALSLIGLKLRLQVGAAKPRTPVAPVGALTGRWLKQSGPASRVQQRANFVRANWG